MNGAGFPVGETVTVVFGEMPIANAVVDDAGVFQVLPAAGGVIADASRWRAV